MTTSSLLIDLPANYHSRLNKDIEDRIKYQISNVKELQFSEKSVRIFFSQFPEESSKKEAINQRIEQIFKDVSFSQLEFQETCLYENLSDYIPTDHIARAFELNLLYELSPGVYVISGFLYNLKNYLDQKFTNLALELKAKPIELPSFISTKDLLKAGHFETFPHHVYLGSHINFTKDKCKLDKKISTEELITTLDHHVTHSEYCLTPSVCYNYYRSLEGKKISSFKDTIVTAKCRCFRYELSTVRPFQRQREFEMREIIFLGSPAEINDYRETVMKRVWDIALEFDLKAQIKNAFDPFFTDNLGPRAAIQFNRNMKYELLAEYEPGKTVAISSFNIHSATFGKAFNINGIDNKNVNSGCVGFGLERWVLALISKFGLEKNNWPSTLHHLF